MVAYCCGMLLITVTDKISRIFYNIIYLLNSKQNKKMLTINFILNNTSKKKTLFQDPATLPMENIITLNHVILFFLIIGINLVL